MARGGAICKEDLSISLVETEDCAWEDAYREVWGNIYGQPVGSRVSADCRVPFKAGPVPCHSACISAIFVVCALSKVHKFSGCNTHPATLAPAGSTWSGPGGDEWPEALQENPSFRREAQRAGRNVSEHRAGPENADAEADSP